MKKYPKIICSVLLAFLIIISNTTLVFAEKNTEKTTKSYLLTLICKNESDLELTDYDVVILKMYHKNSGITHEFILYGYNNFTDKYTMPAGDYMITELYVSENESAIFYNPNTEFSLNSNYSVIIPLDETGMLSPENATPEESTTYYNPFENPNLPEEETSESTSGNQESENTSDNQNFTEMFTNTSELTTDSEEHSDSSKVSDVIIISLIFVFVLLILAIIIIIKKRNKD